jgi:molecular chaperone DnaK (HSP70)
MPYVLGIALGRSRVTAAVCRRRAGTWDEPEPATPEPGQAWLSPALHVGPDGSVVAGQAARRQAATKPERLIDGFVDRTGDPVPVLVDGDAYLGEALTAALVGWVVDRVADAEHGPAERIVLAHPAEWGPHRRSCLRAALESAGLAAVLPVPVPVAVAVCHDAHRPVSPGALLAVCRLGGYGCDAAVLRRGPLGFELLAHSGGTRSPGGEAVDDELVRHVLGELGGPELDPDDGDDLDFAVELRQACVTAKERLSRQPEVVVPLPPGAGRDHVVIGRAEFERLARPLLTDAVADVRDLLIPVPADQLAAVVLAGGTARIPAAAEIAESVLGRPVSLDLDPGSVACRGATLLARPRTAEPEPAGTGHGELVRRSAVEDTGAAGEPPPRPPVRITPLEPPPRFGRKRRGDRSAVQR